MTWWMVLLLIVLIFFLIGRIRLGVRASYAEQNAEVTVRVGPIPIRLLPKPESGKKPSAEKPEKEKKEKKKESRFPKDPQQILQLARLAVSVLGDLRRKIVVDELVLRITYGGADPADAAINYGRTWAVFGALIPVLDQIFQIKKRDIQPILDYNEPEKKLDAKISLFITVGRCISLLLRAGFGFLRLNWKKGSDNHESSSV